MAKFCAGVAVGAVTTAVAVYFLKKRPSGFLALVTEAEATVGAANILPPAEVKELLATTPDALLLDVQDGGDKVDGSHRVSLGSLAFKASTDLPGFKDPQIADRRKDQLIVVNCGLGGQAKLGAAMLVDYGAPPVHFLTHLPLTARPPHTAHTHTPRTLHAHCIHNACTMHAQPQVSPTSRSSTAAVTHTSRPSRSRSRPSVGDAVSPSL